MDRLTETGNRRRRAHAFAVGFLAGLSVLGGVALLLLILFFW